MRSYDHQRDLMLFNGECGSAAQSARATGTAGEACPIGEWIGKRDHNERRSTNLSATVLRQLTLVAKNYLPDHAPQPAYPFGFALCQRQASAHISLSPRVARHPIDVNACFGSA